MRPAEETQEVQLEVLSYFWNESEDPKSPNSKAGPYALVHQGVTPRQNSLEHNVSEPDESLRP